MKQGLESRAGGAAEKSAAANAGAGEAASKFYLRPDEAAQFLGVSKRTLSNLQKARAIPFSKLNRVVVFKTSDIIAAVEKFRVAPVGEPRLRKATPSKPTAPVVNPMGPRKRRMGRIPSPANMESQT
jgi:excisionase family DNA binding protein